MDHEQQKPGASADTNAPAETHSESPAGEARPSLSVEQENEQLRSHVEQIKSELAERQKQTLYDRAELENFRRRIQREKAESLRYAVEPLSRDLLPVVDNLERAIEHGANGQSILDGVQMVLKMFIDVLARHGIGRIEAVGERFDPAKHEAIAQIESEAHEANHVIQQHLVGYQLHDRLLRPAMVTVSSGKTTAAVESPENSD